MRIEKNNFLTDGNIAKELGISDAKVKKAIQELKIVPAAKKEFVIITQEVLFQN